MQIIHQLSNLIIRHKLVLPFLILFIFHVGNIAAQVINFDNWQIKDGLPQNSIQQIVQTRDGYIWIGTDGGLARFDGVKFTIFNSTNTPQLKTNRIRLLHENKRGDLVISPHDGGVLIYRNNEFVVLKDTVSAIDEFDKLARFTPRIVYEDQKGRLFLFYRDVLLLTINSHDYSVAHEFKHLQRQRIESIFELDQTLYFVIESKVYRWENQLIEVKNLNAQSYYGYTFDKTNKCSWVVNNHKILKYDKFKLIKEINIPKLIDNIKYKDVVINNDNILIHHTDQHIYISSPEGNQIVKFNKSTEQFETYRPNLGTNFGILNQMLNDREGNMWFGTSTGGIFKEKPSRFEYLDKLGEHKSHNFYPIVKTPHNHILIGSHTGFFYEFDEFGNHIPLKFTSKRNYITALECFNNAVYYCSNSYSGITKLKDGVFKDIPFPESNTSVSCAIYKTKNNQLLVGHESEIYQLINDELKLHPASKLAKFSNISTFFEDHKNQLWFSTDYSLLCYNPVTNSIKTYQSKLNNEVPHYYRGIYEDQEGRIFAGSYGNGITLIENDKVYTLNMNDGLAENVVSTITGDKKGNLWFTGNKGLTRVLKSEFLEVINKSKKKVNVFLYNEETDNLRTGEFNGGIQHAKCWLGEERYLFPSINGCVMVDFSNFKINEVIPPVHIENITFGDSVYKFQPKIELPFAEQRLDIQYTALSFVSPTNVNFKYMLVGYDKDWIDGGKNRNTFYNKIPPGNYTFKVIASNNEGIWNEQGASFELTIVPPYYMTLWFKFFIIIIAFGATILSIVGILNSTKKRELEKSALMDILPDLVIKLTRNGEYLDTYGNPSILVEPFEKLKGRNIRDFVGEDVAKIVSHYIEKAIDTKTIQLFEYQLKLADGKVHDFEGRIIAKDKEEVLLISRDITEANEIQLKIIENEKKLLQSLEKEKKLLKRITEQQKQQLEAIIQTEEDERRRIATDLHDGIGQMLSSVKINLSVANERIEQSDSSHTKALINKSKEAIDEMTQEIRNIAYNLLPPSLEQFGLSSAMEEEIKKLQASKKQSFQFISSLNNQKLDSKIEIVLFRSFQEIINNAIKHAQSDEITIQLIQHEEKIVLMIEDNGKGFNFAEGFQKKDSLGLKNLYSRMNLINGKIKVDSNPNAGTSITLEVTL